MMLYQIPVTGCFRSCFEAVLCDSA